MSNDRDPVIQEQFQVTLEGKKLEEDWTFATADTQYLTHGIHPYPARMIPQIARRLIGRFSVVGDVVLDPFCGSGTVTTECRLISRNGIGNDINPLACLLAKVKSTPIDRRTLERYIPDLLQAVEQQILKSKHAVVKTECPSFKNVNHWFKESVIDELAIMIRHVKEIDNEDVRDFAKACFSLTTLKASNIDFENSPTHPRALPHRKLKGHNPQPFEILRKVTLESMTRMGQFCDASDKSVRITILNNDARNLPLPDESANLIVTSPPYGEEQNTIGYMRWAKLVLFWLGFGQPFIRNVQKSTLGGTVRDVSEVRSATLKEIIDDAKTRNVKVVREALSFFDDYQVCLKEMFRLLKTGAHCCIVIGNRSLLGKRIHMDVVTKDLGEHVGFTHEKTFYRSIPKKDMPYANIMGETINRENIVILRKP